MSNQRLRIWYVRGEAAREFSSRQLIEAWVGRLSAAIGEIGPPQARPRLALAAPVPAGMTSDAEVLDAFIEEGVSVSSLRERLGPEIGAGLTMTAIHEVGLGWPSVQSDVRWAAYEVTLPGVTSAAAEASVCTFLARDSVPWARVTETRTKLMDLRDVVQELDAVEDCGATVVRMRLQTDGSVTGRPDEVLGALGLGPAARVHRTALGLATKSQVREAWRRNGRFVSG